jgi:hypothetical protein
MSALRMLAAILACAAAAAQPKVNPTSQILSDFSRRVSDYLKVQKAARSNIHGLKPTNSREEIEHHEHELAREIRKARNTAKQGDLFSTEIASEFRRLIAEEMHSPEAARIRESLRSAAPVSPQAIYVNASYPPATPLQSTPPSLLKNLPELPQGLDYRVVGNALILRDVDANLIVDYIPNAIS